MNFVSSPLLLAPLVFLKGFCHSTAFCFASKHNDTDHKQKNKEILTMWGKGEHDDNYTM